MKKLLLASGFGLWAVMLSGVESSFAEDKCIPEKPSSFRFVNNFSKEFPDFLSADEAQTLENKLVQFNKETSNQIVIVIVDDLCGYDANEFSTRLGQSWGVGQGKFDNGVVVMIKPTGDARQRDAYIAVGYGLEGVIPDITAKQILEYEIIPRFKNGNFYEALNSGTDVLISLAKKEFNYQDYQKNRNKGSWLSFFLPVLIVFLLFIYFISRNSRGYTMQSGRVSRTYYGGRWGSSGGGGSWGGGGGGGGSFGGGGFGGGGAGGKW